MTIDTPRNRETAGDGRQPPPRPLDVVLGGLDAAALVLATVFLASGAVRREVDTFAWGLALLALALGAGFAARWLTDERIASPGWRRAGRALLVLTGGFAALVAVRGVQTLASLGGRGGAGPTPSDRPEPDARLLLVTLDDASSIPGGERGVPGLAELDTAVHASPRRDAALASVLTGLEVIEHRLVFDGDDPRRGAPTAAEVLVGLGFRTAAFGCAALPRWARRGAEEVFDGAGLGEAVGWLARGGPSFAHVHVAGGAALDAAELAAAAALDGAVVVVVTLPSGAPRATGVDAARARLLASERWSGPVSPRSTTVVLPTLLRGAGVEWRPADVPLGSLDRLPDVPIAVCFRHGAPDEVHRAVVLSAAGHIPSGALEISRLPGGGLDDWEVGGALEDHFVYRTGVTPIGDAGPPGEGDLELVEAFRAWRERNGAHETPRTTVGAAGR